MTKTLGGNLQSHISFILHPKREIVFTNKLQAPAESPATAAGDADDEIDLFGSSSDNEAPAAPGKITSLLFHHIFCI